MERQDQAAAEIRRAHELDPLSLIINTDIGFQLYYTRHYDQAISQLKTTLEMKPDFPLAHLWLGRAYQEKAMYGEALAEFKTVEAAFRDWPVAIAAIGFVDGVSGRRTDALKVLSDLKNLSERKYVTSYGTALVHAGLGDRDNAFLWLDRAYEERTHWLVWLKLDPRWDTLRADPRFIDLVRRVGLY
ncbi:MAG TPA: tetratricopeptide repeat protein [Pyrinomonadaceae bacterium]|nr:tetratricopeptide repeat protein [Pyrinomonadaceae bacterium]